MEKLNSTSTPTEASRGLPTPWSPRRAWTARLGIALFIAASAAVGLSFALRFGEDPSFVPSPVVGQPAPQIALPRLEGGDPIDLAAMRGRIVVVNFWASWCLACRSEHPDLIAVSDAYRDSGVSFVGIVYQDTVDNAIRFLDEMGWGYDYALDPDSRAAIDFGVFGVPETFFIDNQGIIVGKITGESDAFLLSSAIEAMLKGERPGSQTAGTVQPSP